MPIDTLVPPAKAGKDAHVHLNYLANIPLYDQVKPVQAVPGFLDKGHRSNIQLEQGPLETIHDIRSLPKEKQFDLESNGFQFVRHETQFNDWTQQDALWNVYVPEVENLIKLNVPGADEVHIADVRLRYNNNVGTKNADGLHKNPYARQVHVDDTATSLTPKFQGVEDMRAAWFDRVRVINIWRPINQPVYDCALAVCDAASLKDGDVIECDRIFLNTGAYHDTMGVVKYREGYEWYYMSEQTPEEAVMFTQHDSDVIKRRKTAPGCCLHTAFDVPGPMPPGAKPRESVEVRAFVFSYPECKIKPPGADRMLSSGLPITGSNVQHQPINAQLQRSDSVHSITETPSKQTNEERFMDDIRLHEIILLRKQLEQLVEVNRKLKKSIDGHFSAEKDDNPAHQERALRSVMTALSLDREYSWDAAEMWRKECAEQQKRIGYLPAMSDLEMDQLVREGPYMEKC